MNDAGTLGRSLCLAFGRLLVPALGQAFAPLGRPLHVGSPSAFDPVRRRLVMFDDDRATWELDGNDLLVRSNLAGAPTPPARVGHTMCYDEVRRYVLMFGGMDAGALRNDTWTYDGSRWSQLTGGPAPTARFGAATTWDSTRGRVVLWGGVGGLNDTWEHDGSSWLFRSSATAPPGHPGRMAFDRQRGVAVLVAPTTPSAVAAATWEWNGTSWTLRTTSGPIATEATTMAFDALRNRTVLAGGPFIDRIWEWDGTAWTASSPLLQPFLRMNAAGWFDPGCGCVTIAGGADASGLRADRWQWNGQTLTLVQGDSGPQTADGAMMPDTPRGRTLYFGGRLPNGERSGETWALIDGSWSAVPSPSGPSPRWGAAAAHNLLTGENLLFGGSAPGVLLGDTWSIAGAGWVARGTTGPTPRSGAVMAADLVRNVVVLFGGQTAVFGVGSDETWEWNASVWTQRPAGVRPPQRVGAAMAFHPQLGRVLLFGGQEISGPTLNDTWCWDGTHWSNLAPATAPPLLDRISMSSDLAANRCTLIGRSGAQQQVWVHDGTNWLQLLGEQAPLHASWHPCVSGPRLDSLVCTRVGPAAAELTFSPGRVAAIGVGCGTPGSTLLVRSRPRVGTTTGLELMANPNRAVLFALDLASGNTPLGGGCTLWLSGAFVGLFQVSDALGMAKQALPLPPNLLGLDVYAQAAALEPLSSSGLVLTQGLQLTLGH